MIRLSSAGDVAMTLPVLHSLLKAYPSLTLTIVTKKQYADLFTGLDARIVHADTKGQHKGLVGVYKLYSQIKRSFKIDAVADLHNVYRSKLLGLLFRLSGKNIATIDKQRKEKKELTRKDSKILRVLDNNFTRYSGVFNKLGFQFELSFKGLFINDQLPPAITAITGRKEKKWIGIAPFAAFKWKEYPMAHLRKVISLIHKGNKILFFGGGEKDGVALDELVKEFPGALNMANRFSLADELRLMAHLDVMLAMDSANMHFASLVNIPVVSIWGATHPHLGFAPWQQPEKNMVQIPLFCRPCSVYGNVPCYRGDHACMNGIAENKVMEHLQPYLGV